MPLPGSPTVSAINAVLDALVLYVYGIAGTQPAHHTPSLIDEIKSTIARLQGKPVSARDLAHTCGYSEQYLRHHFKQRTGEQLKKYIDRYRANCIEQAIKHSDLSLKEIAYTFDFPDPQSFSRFVRRVCGASPRQLRE
jgi:two-component system response regulator YesN